MSAVAINLIPMRQGVDPARFEEFSATVDQPTLLAQDVVKGFEVYRVGPRDSAQLGADIVEVLTVSSWDEWVEVRDNHPDLKPVTDGFDELVDSAQVRSFLLTPVRPL